MCQFRIFNVKRIANTLLLLTPLHHYLADIVSGDIVYIKGGDQFPADLIALKSSVRNPLTTPSVTTT